MLVVCEQGGSTPHGWFVPRLVVRRNGTGQLDDLGRSGDVQRMADRVLLGSVLGRLSRVDGRNARHGEVA